MGFIVANQLSRNFDLSDPWLVRLLARRSHRILHAVKNISFSVEKGTTFALVGESGSGKSTVAKMVVGLLQPSTGTITIKGKHLYDKSLHKSERQSLRRSIQMIFQSPYASLNPRWKIGSILREPLQAFHLIGKPKAQQDRVIELLEQVGLVANDAKKYPHEFSGGQRQRISIARALASQPDVIVCDEPTSALDVSVQAQVLNLLKKLQQKHNLTYIFITHDLAVVSKMATSIGVLHQGELIENKAAKELFQSPQHPYTQMLLDSAPRIKKK